MVSLSDKSGSMPARLLSAEALRSLLEPTRWKILQLLAEEPCYASEAARRLELNEQLAHYHFNRLRGDGVIEVVRTEARRGAVTRFFGVKDKAFAVMLRDERSKGRGVPPLLRGFYPRGSFDGKIVVGSPDPHGPFQARARDGYYAADLALYLGSLGDTASPSVRLDTEVRSEELRGNVVLVGGPIVNLVTARINDSLPLRIEPSPQSVFSEKSGKHYHENAGMVYRAGNPWGDGELLVVAGRSIGGTKAAILAVVQKAALLTGANVVRGVDLDGDGVVDAAEIVE